jgi:hypothetical protein
VSKPDEASVALVVVAPAPPVVEIPAPIVRHIFRCAALVELPEQLQAYDASTARDRHITLIREFLGVTAYGPAARKVLLETCLQAARTRDAFRA